MDKILAQRYDFCNFSKIVGFIETFRGEISPMGEILGFGIFVGRIIYIERYIRVFLYIVPNLFSKNYI
jgi:hypothetical protein